MPFLARPRDEGGRRESHGRPADLSTLEREPIVLDLLYLLILMGAFALLAGLVAACDRLVGAREPVAVPAEIAPDRDEVAA